MQNDTTKPSGHAMPENIAIDLIDSLKKLTVETWGYGGATLQFGPSKNPQFTPNELRQYLDNSFYTRTRKIKIELTLETFKYIRQFTQQHCTIELYRSEDDHNALLTNRAIIELMIEIMDKLNRKMANLKQKMTITFTIPQAWAFTEIYSAIDADTMNDYTFATIQPIVDQFNQQLL